MLNSPPLNVPLQCCGYPDARAAALPTAACNRSPSCQQSDSALSSQHGCAWFSGGFRIPGYCRPDGGGATSLPASKHQSIRAAREEPSPVGPDDPAQGCRLTHVDAEHAAGHNSIGVQGGLHGLVRHRAWPPPEQLASVPALMQNKISAPKQRSHTKSASGPAHRCCTRRPARPPGPPGATARRRRPPRGPRPAAPRPRAGPRRRAPGGPPPRRGGPASRPAPGCACCACCAPGAGGGHGGAPRGEGGGGGAGGAKKKRNGRGGGSCGTCQGFD